MKHINIEQFSNGELTQQINREMEAVARNSSARLFAMLTMRYEATFYTARRLVEAGSIAYSAVTQPVPSGTWWGA